MPYELAPRLRGSDYRGMHRYFVTICVEGRARVLIDGLRVDPIIGQLLRTSTARHLQVTAYCVMPDHLHALLEATRDDADLTRAIQLFKQCSSYQWKLRTGSTLWQRSYYDRVLRTDEDTMTVARYILANPVRAGLVTQVLDYPFIGSGVMDVRDLLWSV